MIRPIKVEPLDQFRLRVSYPDGVSGTVDLAADVGRGVFAPLANIDFFRKVHIGDYGQIAWSDEIEICSDAIYQELISRGTPAHA